MSRIKPSKSIPFWSILFVGSILSLVCLPLLTLLNQWVLVYVFGLYLDFPQALVFTLWVGLLLGISR